MLFSSTYRFFFNSPLPPSSEQTEAFTAHVLASAAEAEAAAARAESLEDDSRQVLEAAQVSGARASR